MKRVKRAAMLAVLAGTASWLALTAGVASRGAPAASAAGAVPARQQGRPDQARDLPAVRQHALPARPPERPVRSRADAASPELPEGQRHAAHERPHDPDLAHSGRHPGVAHGPLPGPQRADGRRTATTTSRRTGVPSFTLVVQVLDGHGRRGRTSPLPNMVTRRRPDHARSVGRLHARRLRRRRRVGPPTSCSRTTRPRPAT